VIVYPDSVTEPRQRVLDRIPHLDPRNREFAVRDYQRAAGEPRTADKGVRSYKWRCDVHLDQGRQGACVGHGFAHDAAARPVVRSVSEAEAMDLYHLAQSWDPWSSQPHDGTTVLAGAKAYVTRGFATGYRWAFGLADTLQTMAWNGPVVFGVDWLDGMFDVDDHGFIHAVGPVAGGHCVLGKAVSLTWHDEATTADKHSPRWLDALDLELSYVTLNQSWGADYGDHGDVKLTLSDLDILLHRQGEVCVPVGRK
jgi:hypothetical protein